jgi:2-keto-3-deoxy-L-rhamnonate aldolase RhmA
MTRSVEIAKAMAVAGFDWLFLDMEHGVMSLEACAQISTAALDADIAPIARVPNGEYTIATRALDNGALGIAMPHVDSAAEAREVVKRLKYPPVGHRSMGGIGPHYGLRSALGLGDPPYRLFAIRWAADRKSALHRNRLDR